MGKIQRNEDTITIHAGDWWKLYQYSSKNNFSAFRTYNIGPDKLVQRTDCYYKKEKITFSYTFSNEIVVLDGRTFKVYDDCAYELLKKFHKNGELLNYKFYRVDEDDGTIKEKDEFSSPEHWYFPISYQIFKKRQLENTKRALAKIGKTLEDLN